MPRAKQKNRKAARTVAPPVKSNTPIAPFWLENISPALRALLLLLGIPLVLQLAYSWMGFNPTDDGFILAYSRRVLNGQIPHLDFISHSPCRFCLFASGRIGCGRFHILVLAFLFGFN